MAKGKRSGRRAEDVIASHSMKHHNYVGEAEPERVDAERRKQEHAKKARKKQKHETVREMAPELEQGTARRPSPEIPAQDRRRNESTAQDEMPRGLFGLGLRLLEEARDDMPRLLEALRLKAEERLAAMPRPVKLAVHRAEQAAALLAAPARIGVALMREVLHVPMRILGSLRRPEA